jgi:hypothetical protein
MTSRPAARAAALAASMCANTLSGIARVRAEVKRVRAEVVLGAAPGTDPGSAAVAERVAGHARAYPLSRRSCGGTSRGPRELVARQLTREQALVRLGLEVVVQALAGRAQGRGGAVLLEPLEQQVLGGREAAVVHEVAQQAVEAGLGQHVLEQGGAHAPHALGQVGDADPGDAGLGVEVEGAAAAAAPRASDRRDLGASPPGGADWVASPPASAGARATPPGIAASTSSRAAVRNARSASTRPVVEMTASSCSLGSRRTTSPATPRCRR